MEAGKSRAQKKAAYPFILAFRPFGLDNLVIDLERPQDGCDDGGGARGHGVLRGEERDEHRQLDVQALLSVVSEGIIFGDKVA